MSKEEVLEYTCEACQKTCKVPYMSLHHGKTIYTCSLTCYMWLEIFLEDGYDTQKYLDRLCRLHPRWIEMLHKGGYLSKSEKEYYTRQNSATALLKGDNKVEPRKVDRHSSFLCTVINFFVKLISDCKSEVRGSLR